MRYSIMDKEYTWEYAILVCGPNRTITAALLFRRQIAQALAILCELRDKYGMLAKPKRRKNQKKARN
jgi:hypothetical protein